jgi:hypothetical protein
MHQYKRHRPGPVITDLELRYFFHYRIGTCKTRTSTSVTDPVSPVITDLELNRKSNTPALLSSIVYTFFHLLLLPSYYRINGRQLDLQNADASSIPSVSEPYKGSVRGT